MFYLIDKRTSFYYCEHHEAYIGVNERDFPKELLDNPYLKPEFFEDSEQLSVFTSMYNQGIFTFRIGRRPMEPELIDLDYLSPDYLRYDLSKYILGDKDYEKLIWKEKGCFLMKMKDIPEFLTTTVNDKQYYCAFSSVSEANDYISLHEEFSEYKPLRLPFDRSLSYCLIGCGHAIFLNGEDNKKKEEIKEQKIPA